MIVDDAMFMRCMINDILERAEHTVCGEEVSGKDAVAKYEKLRPDVVTMDIIMPDMSGIELVKEIKKLNLMQIF